MTAHKPHHNEAHPNYESRRPRGPPWFAEKCRGFLVQENPRDKIQREVNAEANDADSKYLVPHGGECEQAG